MLIDEFVIYSLPFIIIFGIETAIDIYLQLRHHHHWDVEVVEAWDNDKIMALLSDDFEFVMESEGKKVFRRRQ
jgi:hypothetical protein